MHRILILLLPILVHLSAYGQEIPRIQDQALLDTIMQIGESSSAMRDSVNWDEIKLKMASLHEDSGLIQATKYMLRELKDFHGRIWANRIPYNGLIKHGSKSTMVWGDDLKSEYRMTSGPIEGEVIRGDIGYLRLPGIAMSPKDSERALKIYETIEKLTQEADLKGWILDLRLNGGGTMYPMLSGLSPFFGEDEVGSFIDPEHDMKERWFVRNGDLYFEDYQVTDYGLPTEVEVRDMPVVVLISSFTRSSGEVVALSFKNKPGTWFLGEETGAYTTTVSWQQLTADIVLQLTISYYADRKENVYRGTPIPPDEFIEGGDNFDELEKDAKVQRAVEWLDQISKKEK